MDAATKELITEWVKEKNKGKIIPDVEIRRFLHVAEKSGLDPLSNQLHLVPRWDNKAQTYNWTVQTGIDGFRLVAARTGEQGGNDEAVFEGTVNGKYPEKCTFTVYRINQGIRCPYPATARWAEYYPGDGGEGFMWRNKPHIMLEKCTEALSNRRAFPQELSGLYIKEEMESGDAAQDRREATPAEEVTQQPKRAETKVDLTEAQLAERNRLQDCMYENAKNKFGYDEKWVQGWLEHTYPGCGGYAAGLSDEQFEELYSTKLSDEQKAVVRPPSGYTQEEKDRVNELLVRSAEENNHTIEEVEAQLKGQFPESEGTVETMSDDMITALVTGWGEAFVQFVREGTWPAAKG